jgi:tetratricopeptide (TPR) repeat protein
LLAYIACHYDYDWAGAEREFRTALELNPSYASAHQWYGLGLMAHGRFAESRQQLETARRLDPLALIVQVDMALLLKFQRDFDGVIKQSQAILQIDPNYHLAYSMLAVGYYCSGRYDEWRAADAKEPQEGVQRALVNHNPEEVKRLLTHLTDLAEKGQYRPYYLAVDAARAGRHDLALDWLEHAYQERDYWAIFINVDPELDGVHADPRFQTLTRRLGLVTAP